MSALVDRLIGWTPFRAAWHGPEMLVDWCDLGAGRMTEPFFYETVVNAMRNPFNLVFQQRTPIEALAELAHGLAPSGFIFHMSRCGSTLVSQAFAAFESLVVVSEAAPLRNVLRAAHEGRATPDQAKVWLSGMINAYAQPRFSYETKFVVKFMAADALDIALVRRAFPEVPWIFVTRDPAEILASQARAAGIDLVRGQIAASRLGLAENEVWTMDDKAYQALVLAALRARGARRAWLRQGPDRRSRGAAGGAVDQGASAFRARREPRRHRHDAGREPAPLEERGDGVPARGRSQLRRRRALPADRRAGRRPGDGGARRARVGMTPAATRRPETPQDADFRYALFRGSRQPQESLPGLDPELADRLFRHQFAGQVASYRDAYPAARHDIVEVDGAPVGRIVVDKAAAGWTVVDIALVETWRGRGLGTRLLAEVIAQAAGVPVRLRVATHNAAAQRLYARLGFVRVAATEIDVELVHRAPGAEAPAFPDRLRLPLVFDAAAMAADVATLADAGWIAHFVTQNYDGDWSVIPLRGQAGATHPVTMIYSDPSCRDWADTPLLAACPAIRTALAAFRCPLQAVRLMRLGPGSIIKEHRDPDLAFEDGCVRLHVPITTNADVDFRLAGRRIDMAPGSAWYLRLTEPHSVAKPRRERTRAPRGRRTRRPLARGPVRLGHWSGLTVAAGFCVRSKPT